MPFQIVRQDITKLKTDAIVNAANAELLMGGGVCGHIFRAAGQAELQKACDLLSPVKTGEAVITKGLKLPAKYIIHAVGPIYHPSHKRQSEEQLRAAYTNSMKRAVEHDLKSIAFPLISSGIYGYPKQEALQVATSAIRDFLENYDLDVTLVVFDQSAFIISQELLGEVRNYLQENYESEDLSYNRVLNAAEEYDRRLIESRRQEKFPSLEPGFAQKLFGYIDQKGKEDKEVYKKANLDRKLFSKIKSIDGYTPTKRTALALAISLELSLEETEDLLNSAGYALSRSQKFDVIVEYFIIQKEYDIYKINEVLFGYEQPLLGF